MILRFAFALLIAVPVVAQLGIDRTGAGVIQLSGPLSISVYNPPAPPPPGPETISNLVLTFDAATIEGLANGTSVSTNADPYNVSNIWRAPGTNPTKFTIEGLSTLRSVAAAQRLNSSNIMDATFNTNFTIVSVTRAITNQVSQYYASYSGTTIGFSESQSGGTRANNWFGLVGGAITPAHGQVISYAYDGVSVRMMRNKNILTSPAKTGNLGMSGSLTIGSLSTAASPLFGDIRRIYVYNRPLATNEINSIVDYSYYYDTGFAGMDTYLFVGDSQSTTLGGSITYISVVVSNLTTLGAVYNYTQTYAGAGWTTATALNGVADLAWIGLPNLAKTNIAVMWIGTNDDSGGTNGPTIVSRISQLAYKYQTNNCYVAWMQMLTKTNGNETTRQYVNTNITANPALYNIDKVIPIAADPRLQNYQDTNYFSTDGLHLNNGGKIVVADLATPYIYPW